MRLTLAKLKKMGACPNGLRRFAREYPRGCTVTTERLMQWGFVEDAIWLTDRVTGSLDRADAAARMACDVVGKHWLFYDATDAAVHGEVMLAAIAAELADL